MVMVIYGYYYKSLFQNIFQNHLKEVTVLKKLSAVNSMSFSLSEVPRAAERSVIFYKGFSKSDLK